MKYIRGKENKWMAPQAAWRYPVCKHCSRGLSGQASTPHARFPVFTLNFNFNFRFFKIILQVVCSDVDTLA
jgi:hypothetical protein